MYPLYYISFHPLRLSVSHFCTSNLDDPIAIIPLFAPTPARTGTMSVVSSSSQTHSPLSKRSRLDSEVADDVEVDGEMDDATKAKVARKEARVIRNRESAQRSRNQRKQYLANLEVRNRELEEEVRRLRGSSNTTSTTTATSSASVTPPRETSPEQTVLSFAGELGLPPQMVSSGVSLSAVAPPPSDAEVAVKQELVSASASSTTTSHADIDQLVAQNNALTQRVTMLENLLKQVVAVSNFGGLAPLMTAPSSEPTLPVHQSEPPVVEDDTFDITSFIESNHATDAPTTPTGYSVQSSQNPSASSIHPVACHSAAVATFVLSPASAVDEGKAQQRARGTGMEMSLESRLITSERLDKVARILGCLAQLRGWTRPTTTKFTTIWDSTSACRMRRHKRRGVRSRCGMRG